MKLADDFYFFTLSGDRKPLSDIHSISRSGQCLTEASLDRVPNPKARRPFAKMWASAGAPDSRYFWYRRSMLREAPRSSAATHKKAGGASRGTVSGIPTGPG